MGLSVNTHPDAWMDGVAVAGQDLRLQVASAMLTGASPSGTTGIAARPGVRYGVGSPLLVQASSGMNLTVNAGVAFVQGSASATAGMYTCCLDTTGTITVATSDPTNPRIDNVIAQVTDNGDNTSTSVVTLQTGTPAASPSAPALPANALLLAQIAVGAGVGSITAANITDGRVYTSASGGIVPMANTTGGITGPAGMYAHDLSSGRLRVSDGAGNARQPKVGAFAPVTKLVTSPVNAGPGATVTIASVSFATDGQTEIVIDATFPGIGQPSPNIGDNAILRLLMDGTSLSAWVPGGFLWWSQRANDIQYEQGGRITSWVTPAAGSHTVLWRIEAGSTNIHTIEMNAVADGEEIVLRVAPSFS